MPGDAASANEFKNLPALRAETPDDPNIATPGLVPNPAFKVGVGLTGPMPGHCPRQSPTPTSNTRGLKILLYICI